MNVTERRNKILNILKKSDKAISGTKLANELNVSRQIIVGDIAVEHGVYGQITGDLYLSSRRDIKDFIKKLKEDKSNPLSELTDGIHLHTIKCRDNESFEEVIKSLNNKGYLL